MPNPLSVNDYISKIGETIGLSNWILVDQAKIDQFCEVTGDFQFIHNDPTRAKDETPFGGSVAHGFLTLSLITQMLKDHIPSVEGHDLVINYGLNKVRFLEPVPAGARIRGHFDLAEMTPRGDGRFVLDYKVTVEIDGQEKPAMVANWLTLMVSGS